MTLITNELHITAQARSSILVFGADRRITRRGQYHDSRKKTFYIPYLSAGVSYFGLADVYPPGKSPVPLARWLPDFIRRNSSLATLGEFAQAMQQALNREMDRGMLARNPSGFHLCGYGGAEVPDFWYFSNIGGMNDFAYTDVHEEYAEPASHFLCRDAGQLGWNGVDASSFRKGGWIYRNGDLRAHVSAWQRLDEVLNDLSRFPDFKALRTSEDYGRWVRFKLRFIASLYKQHAKHQLIGTPIDVFCISKTRGRAAVFSLIR